MISGIFRSCVQTSINCAKKQNSQSFQRLFTQSTKEREQVAFFKTKLVTMGLVVGGPAAFANGFAIYLIAKQYLTGQAVPGTGELALLLSN